MERYGDILTTEEQSLGRAVQQARREARRLFARILSRRGPLSRVDSFSYLEASDVPRVLEELCDLRLLAFCPAAVRPLHHPRAGGIQHPHRLPSARGVGRTTGAAHLFLSECRTWQLVGNVSLVGLLQHGDHAPAMQAAGRIVRSEQQRGVVVLADPRLATDRFQKCFPSHWHPEVMSDQRVGNAVRAFFETGDVAGLEPDSHSASMDMRSTVG